MPTDYAVLAARLDTWWHPDMVEAAAALREAAKLQELDKAGGCVSAIRAEQAEARVHELEQENARLKGERCCVLRPDAESGTVVSTCSALNLKSAGLDEAQAITAIQSAVKIWTDAALAAAEAKGRAEEREALKAERAAYRGHGPLFVDATPDGSYAIRLLEAYIAADENGTWEGFVNGLPSKTAALLNEINAKRAAELRNAVEAIRQCGEAQGDKP